MTRLAQPPVRVDWLATRQEDVLDPGQPIVDAHHHLFDRPGNRYLAEDLEADLASGHDVRATVFVQARGFYRADGPEALRPVGETAFAARVAEAAAAAGGPRICAAILGYADLTLGEAVRPVLEAHVAAGGDRFRGVRHILAWDLDERLLNPAYPTREDTTESEGFRRGFAELAACGLRFDAWMHYHQIPRLTALAQRFPDVPIVLDHCGGVLGAGAYAGRRGEVFVEWDRAMVDLAACPNVMVKLGGLGMALSGFGFDSCPEAPKSEDLAAAWRPWMHRCIELFGAGRCMFESNFPVDRSSYGYVAGWNAMKLVATGASRNERNALFFGSATRFYGL